MNRKDNLVIATAFDDTVRVYAAATTGAVETARRIHEPWPTATAVLGRLLTAALMMGVMSDNPYRLTVRISGEGPIGEAVAVSNHRGKVKGYLANPRVDLDLNSLGKFDVAGALGKGRLIVTKDLGLKEPYQGIVPLQTGEIGEDLAFYFTKSEQTPSAVALGVLVAPDATVKAAGGLIVQLMPGYTESTASWLEQQLQGIPAVTTLVESGRTPQEIVEMVFGAEGGLKVLDHIELAYQCDCSRERFLGPLLSLGAAELDDIVAEQGRVEVSCHFCNQVYHYQPEELQSGDGEGAHA